MAGPGSPEPSGQLVATDIAAVRSQSVGRVCQLEGVALTEGLRVTIGHEAFMQRPQMMGFYEPANRAIYLREAAQLQKTKTLAHELAHHFAKHKVSGPESETEAEAVSYVVLAHHGLDSGERSFAYIATWSKDKAVLKTALAAIQTVSTTIIDKLNPAPAPQG